MQTIDCRGVKVAYQRQGAGAPLVLLHGFPLNHRLWCEVAPSLQDRFDVIAMDLPGFGESRAELTESWSMEMFADIVAEFLACLQIESSIHLVGLSMGGYIAFEYQRKFRQQLSSLTLCHTRPTADDQIVRRGRLQMATRVLEIGQSVAVDTMLSKLFATASYQSKPKVVASVKEMIESTSRRSISLGQRAMAERRDASTWLTQIDCPVLVIAGEDDRITPSAEMRQWFDQIGQGTFVEIPCAGHSSPLENPQALVFAIREFLTPLTT